MIGPHKALASVRFNCFLCRQFDNKIIINLYTINNLYYQLIIDNGRILNGVSEYRRQIVKILDGDNMYNDLAVTNAMLKIIPLYGPQ